MTEPAIETEASPDLPRLTSLRAFAALFVFGYHLFMEVGSTQGSKLFGLGYAGVTFFFVLSGFVLTWSTRPNLTRAGFYFRRFARIWPLHIVTAIAGGFLYTFGSLKGIVATMFLVQAWFPPRMIHYALNGPSWSLSAEAFFYAIWPFAALYAARRWKAFAAVALLIFALGGLVTLHMIMIDSPGWTDSAYVNPLTRVGEFLIGVALGSAAQQRKRAHVPLPIALGVVAVAWYISRRWFSEDFPMPDFLLTPAFALLIWSAASADIRGRAGLLRHPIFQYAGKISFAFYLVHEFVISRLADRGMSAPVTIVLSLLLSTALSSLGHHAVEKPANVRLRALAERQREEVTLT